MINIYINYKQVNLLIKLDCLYNLILNKNNKK